jgi:hypothetical protein
VSTGFVIDSATSGSVAVSGTYTDTSGGIIFFIRFASTLAFGNGGRFSMSGETSKKSFEAICVVFAHFLAFMSVLMVGVYEETI